MLTCIVVHAGLGIYSPFFCGIMPMLHQIWFVIWCFRTWKTLDKCSIYAYLVFLFIFGTGSVIQALSELPHLVLVGCYVFLGWNVYEKVQIYSVVGLGDPSINSYDSDIYNENNDQRERIVSSVENFIIEKMREHPSD